MNGIPLMSGSLAQRRPDCNNRSGVVRKDNLTVAAVLPNARDDDLVFCLAVAPV
jgi:hypothetical protein